jgi:hypothetical protein
LALRIAGWNNLYLSFMTSLDLCDTRDLCVIKTSR